MIPEWKKQLPGFKLQDKGYPFQSLNICLFVKRIYYETIAFLKDHTVKLLILDSRS